MNLNEHRQAQWQPNLYLWRLRMVPSEQGREGLQAHSKLPVAGPAGVTKAQIEEAASSLFITDGGQEAFALELRDADGDFLDCLYLPDVVALLCHHLGVTE